MIGSQKDIYLRMTAGILFTGILIVIASSCQFRQEKNQPPSWMAVRLEEPEKCVDCHQPSKDMSPWHSYERIGCVSCHLGNPQETEAVAAHAGMISIPGNLSTARQSCGSAGCHPGITERVESSLMTSMSGVINVHRYVLGESDTLDAHVHVSNLGFSPADSYARNLCASCHLGREKKTFGPVTEKSRGGGCNACHLNYSPEAASALAAYRDGEAQSFHPSLSLRVTDDHCFGCHSRSGRISTSYAGWHESQLKDIPADESPDQFRKLEDGRIFIRVPQDVHHELGLSCIDCHSGMEVMGDGRKYFHAEEAVRIRCQDCHFDEPPATVSFEQLDYESQKIVELRPQLQKDMSFVLGGESKYPLVNVIRSGKRHFLISKNEGKKFELSPPGETCKKGDAHDALSCSSCHAAWAPQCIRCHVQFDPTLPSVDLLDRQWVEGKWIETGGHYLAELPGLGVMYKRQRDGSSKRQVEPFIPGMILTADLSSVPGKKDDPKLDGRYFAPIEPHTTRKEARDCESCHLDPVALGYGRGKLSLNQTDWTWTFNALYPSRSDGLPEDAWIGVWEDAPGNRTTRANGRPFSREEQERILTVGICLTCHPGDSERMQRSLTDFPALLKQARLSDICPFE